MVIYTDFKSDHARAIFYSDAPLRYDRNVPKLSGKTLAYKLNGQWTDGQRTLSLTYSYENISEKQEWTYFDEELHQYSLGTWYVVGDSQIELWQRPPNIREIFRSCGWFGFDVSQLILTFIDLEPTEPKFKFWVDQKPNDGVAHIFRTCFVDRLRLCDRKSFRCSSLDEGLKHRLTFKRVHLKRTNDESVCLYE